MALSLFLIVVGLAILVVGGEVLLRGAVGLATLLRLTPAVIALTVVAAGTSVPELAVSLLAASQDSTDLAIGNAIGSNIFNLTFLIGLSALIHPLVISGNTIKLEYPILVLVSLLCLAVCDDGHLSRLDGLTFLAIYVGFTAYLVSLVRGQMAPREEQEFGGEVRELAKTADRPSPWPSLLYVLGGVVLLALGAHATVSGAVALAHRLGMSERIIGLTIVAIGTGLPEVVTSLVSAYRGRADVAIGNAIGSNLFNILVILGLTAVFRPVRIPPETVESDGRWMLGVTVLLFPLMFTGLRINRWEGTLLVLVYAAYIGLLLAAPID